MEKVKLNIGGRIHLTTSQTINKYPDTLLAKLINKENKDMVNKEEDGSYFFDRNPDLFSYVLDFYRVGNIVYPTFVSKDDFLNEMKFWGIDINKEEFPTLKDIVNFNLLFMDIEWAKLRNDKYIIDTHCYIVEQLNKMIMENKRTGIMIYSHNYIDKLPIIFNFTKTEEFIHLAKYNKKDKKWSSNYEGDDLSTSWEEEITMIDCKPHMQFVRYSF